MMPGRRADHEGHSRSHSPHHIVVRLISGITSTGRDARFQPVVHYTEPLGRTVISKARYKTE